MFALLIRRSTRLVKGLRDFFAGWRGAVLIVLAVGLFLAVDIVDVHVLVNLIGVLTTVGAIAVLTSSASRSQDSHAPRTPVAARQAAADESKAAQVVLWVSALSPTREHVMEAPEGGEVLVLCLAPEVALLRDVRALLEEKWSVVHVLQSRRSADPLALESLASLVLGGAAPAAVAINDFGFADLSDEAGAAMDRLSAGRVSHVVSGPTIVIPIDQAGQRSAALAFLETAELEHEIALANLGPLTDTDDVDDTWDAFAFETDVAAIGVIYPYGPAVSALITAARSLGVSTVDIPTTEVVDRVDKAGAAPLTGTIFDFDMTGPACSWGAIMAEVRKPWRALNVGDQRRTQKSAGIVQRRDIAAFKDRHAGERCVVIGNGPSLNALDLTAIAGEITFGVNSIYLAEEQMGFVPTYYMVEDTLVMRENVDEIVAYGVAQKFFPSEYATYFGKNTEGVTFFDMDAQFYRQGSPAFGVPRFSDDYSIRGFCGQSVTFLNLQLAFYMGFREVYLIGMDFSYVIPDTVIRDGTLFTSTEDDVNHFHPKYFGVGKTWKDPKLDRVRASYQLAKRIYGQNGREIINATAGGALELFRRVDYHEVFGGTPPSIDPD